METKLEATRHFRRSVQIVSNPSWRLKKRSRFFF